MFSIEVKTAFFIKVANIVAIEGKPNGDLKGKVLHDETDNSKSYNVKEVALVNGREYISPIESITLQLEPGDYNAEDLIGKRLISYD
ncbi:hypothetical protein E8L90_03420 [Brevibacillus antibioticus]|uniref:Uncharacterized protein n=1 Tax=Brevibacillus antibioticus TaxID=2570228 RepID=A0A4U2Y4G9_9BACL|nr:hypothetical protein [Brevibacillus antibioticus]TKI54562.1 hypothetical protein E8L90_03420 [Brevibacillus antibioticus]